MRKFFKSGRTPTNVSSTSHSVALGLQELYKRHLLPLESATYYNFFYSPPQSDGYFTSKPVVMLLGQYSTGKTTFIRHLLERSYPGIKIGPEPTTDKFVAVMHGNTDKVIPGNAATVDNGLPWTQLNDFGNNFLSRFEVAQVNCPLLQGLTLIDTPGVLSGNKQSDRGYDFEGVVRWFAERADLVLLMFDAHKLDISDEFRRCIASLRGNDSKVRIILNKADCTYPQQLMRIYGALMWSLGKIVPTPEVPKVYIGSYWDEPLRMEDNRTLFEAEASDLYGSIARLPRDSALRKVNDLIKRARQVKVHAQFIGYLRKQIPYFGKTSKQRHLVTNIESVVKSFCEEFCIPCGDTPNVETLTQRLPKLDISKLPKMEKGRIESLSLMLEERVPKLMELIPSEEEEMDRLPMHNTIIATQSTPFLGERDSSSMGSATGRSRGFCSLPSWVHRKYLDTPPSVDAIIDEFSSLDSLGEGRISGDQAKPALLESRLPSAVLHRVWSLADVAADGYLDLYEFALARHFINMKLEGYELPQELPPGLMPAVIAHIAASPKVNSVNSLCSCDAIRVGSSQNTSFSSSVLGKFNTQNRPWMKSEVDITPVVMMEGQENNGGDASSSRCTSFTSSMFQSPTQADSQVHE